MGKTTHGLAKTSEWYAWRGIKQRCFNVTNKDYKNYGARGITVCDRWLKFDNFIKDMGMKPSPKHSIDRIDNNGNYEPSNCRWATKTAQVVNRRKFKNKLSKYVGVTFNKTVNKWQAQISMDGKPTYLGIFSNELDAAKAYIEANKNRLLL